MENTKYSSMPSTIKDIRDPLSNVAHIINFLLFSDEGIQSDWDTLIEFMRNCDQSLISIGNGDSHEVLQAISDNARSLRNYVDHYRKIIREIEQLVKDNLEASYPHRGIILYLCARSRKELVELDRLCTDLRCSNRCAPANWIEKPSIADLILHTINVADTIQSTFCDIDRVISYEMA